MSADELSPYVQDVIAATAERRLTGAERDALLDALDAVLHGHLDTMYRAAETHLQERDEARARAARLTDALQRIADDGGPTHTHSAPSRMQRIARDALDAGKERHR